MRLLLRLWSWIRRVIFRKKPPVKPTGTTSMLTGTSTGIVPPFEDYYIRKYRTEKDDHKS